jgi:hypothetical protein
MTWARLFSPCWLGHEAPIKVLRGKVLSFECSRCCADLGPVLPGQRYRPRKVKKAKATRFTPRVLPMEGCERKRQSRRSTRGYFQSQSCNAVTGSTTPTRSNYTTI